MTVPVLRAEGPVLVFGGPYSNLQATTALFAEAERLGIPPARIVCTGDVVAYGADPAATLDRVMESGCAVIAGNCEENLAGGQPDCGCGFGEGTACDLLSRAWYPYAAARLSGAQRRWMAAMPARLVLEIGGRRLAVIHGGVAETARFLFASAPEEALAAEIASAGCDGVVAGHCGIPFARVAGGGLWLNAGAIGMPADDGTPRSWFALLWPGGRGLRAEIRPLSYDHAAAAAAMRAAGLPEGYATALGSGIWPSCDALPPAERARRGQPLAPPALDW
ncbi:metallophosphoesterase family protein [Muricoccus vinaceus]|uniref:Metallophosphoesterase family protein n=1 Tax=Muricoccus vinaceus TaxID=424704 RepID=A0ABV6IR10_9PROT